MKEDNELTSEVATYYYVNFLKWDEPTEDSPRMLPPNGPELYKDFIGK